MNIKEIEKVLITDSNAATYVTNLKGWVSRNGLFFGEDEYLARYNGATHTICATKGCGKYITKYRTFCDVCESEKYINKYNKLQAVDYKDYITDVIYSDLFDEYFFDISHLYDVISEYCIENSITKSNFDENIFRLQPCKEIKLCEISEDMIIKEDRFGDFTDIKLPDDILFEINKLNSLILDFKTNVYEYDNKRLINVIDINDLDI